MLINLDNKPELSYVLEAVMPENDLSTKAVKNCCEFGLLLAHELDLHKDGINL